jgi:sugar phosphate isomerase/epimerase
VSAEPTWPLAAFLTSLPAPFADAVLRAAALGFDSVDVVAVVERPPADLEALAEAGVVVGCAALGRGLPPGQSLDAADVEQRRAALRLVERQLDDAARLGATCAYLVPPTDDGDAVRQRFGEAVGLLAGYAAGRMVRLCVEHVPGRALSDAAATLDWLGRLGQADLGLLLDVGHCLISGEDAAAVARRAGPRLGHVHLDDNDGRGDLHWPLLSGRLTLTGLHALAEALRGINYRGGLALELNAVHADPEAALRDGKAIVERVFGRA